MNARDDNGITITTLSCIITTAIIITTHIPPTHFAFNLAGG